jgi:uncharacterized protein (TIGR03437 family)
MKKHRLLYATFAALVFLCCMPKAFAQPIGQLDITNCPGGGITINITDAIFTPSTTGKYACIQTGGLTRVQTPLGNLGPGVMGEILSLTISQCAAFTEPGCVIQDFIRFASLPAVHFDLSFFGPGPTNPNCTNAFDSNLPTCGVFVAKPPTIPVGSPWVMTSTPTGTANTLPIYGQVRVGNTVVATFLGNLAGTVPGKSPAQVQNIILTGGMDGSPYGASVIAVPPPAINTTGGVLNGASFSGTAVSPGEIVAIKGTSVSPITAGPALALDGTVSTIGGGTQVLFDGVPAPLLYFTNGQVGAVVPYGVTGQTVVTVTAARVVSSNSVTIPVVATAPGIFTANSSGSGQIAMTNQNGSPNSATNAAAKGSTVTFYATGEGQTSPAGVNGKLATGTTLPKPLANVTVTIGGVTVTPAYAGAAPGAVAGLMQVNVVVPATVASGGAVPVVLTVGTASSPAGTTMAIQ